MKLRSTKPKNVHDAKKVAKTSLPVCLLLLHAFDDVLQSFSHGSNQETIIQRVMSFRKLSVMRHPVLLNSAKFPERILKRVISKLHEANKLTFGAFPQHPESNWRKKYDNKGHHKASIGNKECPVPPIFNRVLGDIPNLTVTSLEFQSSHLDSLLINARNYDGSEICINDLKCIFQYPNKCCAKDRCSLQPGILATSESCFIIS